MCRAGRPSRARHSSRRSIPEFSLHAACKSPISLDCRGFATLQSPRVGKFAAQFVFIEGYAMSVIREADVIAGVADALQYISYYHTPDFIRAMGRAYDMEQSPSARDAIAQILTNSRMCAEGHRPICQHTGIVVVFVKVGMGAGVCPPGSLGVGIGGSAEKAMLLAKKSLMEPIDIGELIARGPKTQLEELRLEIFQRVNALGIGAQGLGGLTTVLDVKVLDYPTHAASLPVAVIPNCAATRHIHFTLNGNGPALLEAPNLDLWPKVQWSADASARRVSLDGLTKEEIAAWKPGERLLLSGKLLTGRDAAHKRICALLDQGKALPDGLDFTGRVIYYVGPVDPVGTEVVGPAGPTTANRMDRFTDTMLGKSGLLAMVGKAERGPETVASIAKHRSAYLIAVGGAAFLVSNAIRGSRVVAFPELGMEAVYEFDVKDMPVTVAVSADGESVHETGPKKWAGKFAGIPVAVE